jgi:CBS domain-containing membrane protein
MHANDPVNRIMTAPVLTITPSESLEEALRLFTSYPVHHLPVVEEECVVGMLSSADVAKLKFFLPPPGTARDALLKERWQVRKIMRSPAVTVAEHESAQRAAEIMATNGIHALPVVNSKAHLIGIVTTTDMMQGCLDPLPAEPADATNARPSDNVRMRALLNVVSAAKRYLNAGQDERLHAALQKALECVDLLHERGRDSDAWGLGS